MLVSQFLKKENNNLDIIRVFCASLVIIGHAYFLNPTDGNGDWLLKFTGFTYYGSIAVKVFFFISGMLVTNSLLRKESEVSFLLSRFFRMMPGLLFVLLVSALIIGPLVSVVSPAVYFKSKMTYVHILSNLLFRTHYTLPGVYLSNFYYNCVNGSLWSLRYEVKCYIALLAVFVACKYTIKRYKMVFNVVCAAVCIDALLQLHIIGRGENPEHSLLPISFAFGVFMGVNQTMVNIDYKIFFGLAALTAIVWRMPVLNEIFFNASVCILMLLVAQSNIALQVHFKYDMSYGLYLWGFVVQQTIYTIAGPINFYLFVVLSLVLSVVMGLVSYLAVERSGIAIGRKLEKALLYKLTSKSAATA